MEKGKIDGRGGSRGGGGPLGPPPEGDSGAGKAPPFYRVPLLPACTSPGPFRALRDATRRHPARTHAMLFTVTLALALGPHPPPLRRGNTLTRRAVLMPTLATGSAALLAVAAAKPASASFGPAGAAVFSVPDLIKINVEEWLALPADKALQRIGSISEVSPTHRPRASHSHACARAIWHASARSPSNWRRSSLTSMFEVPQLGGIHALELDFGPVRRLWAALQHSAPPRQRRVRLASATGTLATALRALELAA